MKTDKLLHILTQHQKGGKKPAVKAKPTSKPAPKPAEKNPYKEINATPANIFRAAVPLPGNVSQMLAKQLFSDARMNNSSLTDEQKIILWNTIQNAKKRSGAVNGGTEYVDYGNQGYGTPDEFNNWFNRGSAGLAGTVYNSLMNPGFNLASTIGRGRYWTDEKDPDTIYYTDVYDWNPGESNFKGSNTYQQVRNYVRSTEDKNLNADKNENYRMQFKLSKADIDAINKKREQRTFLDQRFIDAGPKYQHGGSARHFLQPNDSKLIEGYAIPSIMPSTELATSIGGEGGEPAYLVPSFKYGYPLANPEDEFYNTGDYLGGPFKTWQEADKWDREIRHPYVEKGQPIPSPLKWWGKGYQLGGSSIQQQLINQALGQNNAASVRDQVASTAYPQVSQAVVKKKQNEQEQSDIKKYGSLEKAAQAKAIKNSQAAQKESVISTPKLGQPGYEYYNPEQGEYRDDKTVAPEGSILANMQGNLNAYNEFVSNQTSLLQNLSGPVRAVGAVGALASDIFVNGPIQSALNIGNTVAGNRPLRGDEDFGNLFFDAFNAMPVFSSLTKGAKAFNQASKLASEAAFSPTFGIMPGAVQEGLESSSRFLKKTPVSIPGGVKKGADDVISGNLFEEGIIRMDEADMPITDIMLGHASIPANMTGVKFVKDALQADPVLKREIATIVRDLNKDYGLTLDFRTIDSMEELQKIKESAIDFLQSSDPRAVNARGLFTEKLQQTDANALRADINTRHIKLDQLNKKKKELGAEMVGLNRNDPKIRVIQDEITKINDQIRTTVHNPTEIIFPSGIKYEGKTQMTSKGPVADVKITSVKPGVDGLLKISGDEPNLFNHFYFVSGDLNYTQSELNRLRALPNPDQADLDKIARLEQKITDSLMASGEMFKVSTMNAPKGTVVTETSMSSDSYGMLWNMGKTTAGKKTPYKLLTPAEFSQYDSLKDNWSYMLDGPTQVSMSEQLARGETAGIPLVLPYRSPNTMGYAEGIGKRAPNPNAVGIKTLHGNYLTSVDEVALGVNTQNNLFETANKTFEYQLANGRISQEFYDANIIKWYEDPLNPKNTNLTTTAPKVSASELANLNPEIKKRFAPVQVPDDTHLNSPIFIDRNTKSKSWVGMDGKNSPLVYKYLGIGNSPGDFSTFNNGANNTYFQQAIPTFKKEWKKGGLVRAQEGRTISNNSFREGHELTHNPYFNSNNIQTVLDAAQFVPVLGQAAYVAGIPFTLKDMYNDYLKNDYTQMGIDAMGLIPTFKAFKYAAKGDKVLDSTSKLAKQLRKANTAINTGNLVNDATKKAKGGSTSKKSNAEQQYFQLLINQKNKK